MKKKDITARQEELRAYVREHGLAIAAEGTGLPLCAIRSTYTDTEPIYDHLVRVYQFYQGLVHEQSFQDQHYYIA